MWDWKPGGSKTVIHVSLNDQMCKTSLHFMNALDWIRIEKDWKYDFYHHTVR
jgi:hypothetical protein